LASCSNPYATLGAFHTEELSFLFRALGKLIPRDRLVPGHDRGVGAVGRYHRLLDALRYDAQPERRRRTRLPTYPAVAVGADPEMALDTPITFDPVGYHVAQCDAVAPYQ
jgi:hypothetical protein